MSKHNKTYGKRGASAPVASIQFDKIITDSNKRPTASKSAGVVGKWGTTSFTSLRSSQVNGSKAGKKGMSPVKCLPVDYGVMTHASSVLHSGADAFSFDSGTNSANCPAQLKPRKFFKSRAADDVAKPSSNIQNASSLPNCVEYPSNIEVCGSTNLFPGSSGNVGYLSTSYTSPSAKTTKRGRGRPKGTRTSSPRGTTSVVAKSNPGRSTTTRGRRRAKGNRSIRGQPSGRGKRKRPQWEGESEEEESASSEMDEPTATVEVDPEQEDDNGVHEQIEKKNGTESDEVECKEEPKPPIKLRIIRRNDTNAFVSEVDTEADRNATSELISSPCVDASNKEVPLTLNCQLKDIDIKQEPPKEETSIPMETAINIKSDPICSPNLEAELLVKKSIVAVVETPTNADSVASVSHLSHQQHQRKSSIFKSRASTTQPLVDKTSLKGELSTATKGKKGLALYRHTWHERGSTETAGVTVTTPTLTTTGLGDIQQHSHSPWDDLGDESEGPPSKVARLGANSSSAPSSVPQESIEDDESGESASNVRCLRKVKDYYTVVRNVKKAHQIQESGEFQEFNDDVDYILDALQDRNPTATRCLSAMSLASKCMEPAFRMHLRAHSTVAKFFQALKDAPFKPSVALCTSCIMFVLTQDRLNMDLDRDSLELMLNLLEIDAGQVDVIEGRELEKNKLKVREICEEMVRKGHAPHLQLDKITAAQLAMETLLSLTSKKAGEWFKEELRVLGGLDHIIQTVTACTSALSPPEGVISNWEWDKTKLDSLKKVDRCLRVLENVTFQNDENQSYLMEFSSGRLVDATLNLLKLLSREVAAYWPLKSKDSLSFLLGDSLSNLMKVVMNLTHDSNDESVGSKVYGDKSLTWDTVFTCLLHTSMSLPEEKSFDIMTLALGILINLVERSSVNRDRLMIATVPSCSDNIFDSKTLAITALIDLFIKKEESARLEEARTDEILDGKPDQSDPGSSQSTSIGPGETSSTNSGKNQEDVMEETVKKLLHKAGRHMEDSMVAAYIALLLGYVVMKNEAYEFQVRSLIPEKKFTQMIVVLKKFYEFLKLTANAVTSTRGLKNTQMVIKFMEASDRKQIASETKIKGEPNYYELDESI